MPHARAGEQVIAFTIAKPAARQIIHAAARVGLTVDGFCRTVLLAASGAIDDHGAQEARDLVAALGLNRIPRDVPGQLTIGGNAGLAPEPT